MNSTRVHGTSTIDFDKNTKSVVVTYNKLIIQCVEYNLFDSAKFHVRLNTSTGVGTDKNISKILVLEGDDFAAWGFDDEYIEKWVLLQLGIISPAPIVTDDELKTM